MAKTMRAPTTIINTVNSGLISIESIGSERKREKERK